MNQENITRTLAIGQSDITRHEAYTKAQGLNEFNSLAPRYHKQQITLHYCDIGGTRVLIDPQVKHKYGSNTPYLDIYDCGTCTTANGTGILTLTYSDGKLQVYPYFFNPAEFNSSFEKVVDNVRYISNSIDTPNQYRPTYKSIEDFIQQQVTITINDTEFTKKANSISFVNSGVKIEWENWSPEHINLYYVQLDTGGKIIVTKDGVMQISQYIVQNYGSQYQTIKNLIPVFRVNNNGLPELDAFHQDESAMVIDNIPNSNYAYTVEHFNNECNFVKNCAINSYYHINGLPSNMINMNYNDYLQLQEITTTIEDVNGIQHSIKFNNTGGTLLPSEDIIFTCTPLLDDHKIQIKLNSAAYIITFGGSNLGIEQDANGPLIFPYICGPTYMGTIDTSMYGGEVYYIERKHVDMRTLLGVNYTYKEPIDSADPLLLNNATLMSFTDFNNSYIDIIVDGEPFYKKPNGNGILRHRIYGTDYEIIDTPSD